MQEMLTEKLRYQVSPFMEKKRSESGAFPQDGMARSPHHIQSTNRAVGKRSMTLGWDGEVSVPSGTLRVLLRNM